MKIINSILLSFYFLLVMVGGACAQISYDEALSQFVTAGMAYKEGRYDAAATHYNNILEGGRTSGPLHYNLGNSYFKKGDIGRAILNYERAMKFIPRDSDLNFNYDYVKSQTDQYGFAEKLKILNRLVQSHIHFYTIDEMVLILIGVVMVMGILFLVLLYVRWPESIRSGIFALLLCIFLIYGIGLIVKVDEGRDLVIVMIPTESYFEPRTDSIVHFKLSEGTKAKILKSEGHWIKIQRLDGKIGWIDRNVLEKI